MESSFLPNRKPNSSFRVYNSLSSRKDIFYPISSDNSVTWYQCGPTVYNFSHLGHARTYIAFDVIRRIMNDYFGYKVYMCMNITDIDDKIITEAQKNSCDFSTVAKYWECLFWQDMKNLNVHYPDVVTRVSEYIPEIIDFIAQLILNKKAYESDGDVYFDIENYSSDPLFSYGKFRSVTVMNDLNFEELSDEILKKKNHKDFALWKRSKNKEPYWDSPWGKGRPGWHIECSAMACAILGFPIDIHSGGIDLCFPHHENEIAQSESKYSQSPWVNFFLHSGHVFIKGAKMSKSLKNFITIREMLSKYSFRVIRLLVLNHKWNAPINFIFSDTYMDEMVKIDKEFINFFDLMKTYVKDMNSISFDTNSMNNIVGNDFFIFGCQHIDEEDAQYISNLKITQSEVDNALKDDFNTPEVINHIRHLISVTYKYINSQKEKAKHLLLNKVSQYIFYILKIFGLTNDETFTLKYRDDTSENNVKSSEIMDALVSFRERVTKIHKLKNGKTFSSEELLETVSEYMKYCDEIRDITLPSLGYTIEDSSIGPVCKESSQK